MKNTLSLILGICLILSLAACGGSPASSAAAPASSAAPAVSEISSAEPAGYQPPATVNLIVPYAAGGAVDLGARLFAKYAAQYTDTNLVITNIGGAAGAIGCAEVLKYGTDGSYMIALNPSMGYISTEETPLSFDIIRDFDFCAMMVRDPGMIAIRREDPRFSTAEEFIAYCKENPGITVAVSGTGNTSYYLPYLMSEALGLNLNVVAFDGTGDLKSAFLGSHVDAASLKQSECVPMLNSGQITVIANAVETRSDLELFRDVPTTHELGCDVNMAVSRGFAFKAGTDEAALRYWSDLFGKVTSNPEFLAEADAQGLPIVYLDYEAANASAAEEMELYAELVAKNNA